MTGGYMGKLLFVDLTKRTIEERDLPENLARDFLGGYGLAARLLYTMMKPGVDPLGPDNILGFVTGPVTGSGAFFGGRYTVVCKSPVTGGWNDASSGGFFGPALKKAGYDGVFITGAADKPVYIWINDGKVEIRDASRLWGKDTVETQQALEEETGEKGLRAAVIGPAGEKLSLMAAVINDGHRAAARGGPGAVMGSKNLKAVAAHGTRQVPVAHPDRLRAINQTISAAMKDGPAAQGVKGFSTLGTSQIIAPSALGGDSPVKNWSGAGLVDFGEEAANRVEGWAMDAKYKRKKYACATCPLGCGAEWDSNEGEFAVGQTERPEYESAAAFGVLALNGDPDAVIKCNHICNRYGLDTISVGATIAWAIECYEKGLLTKEDTGGVELTWGNAKAIVELTQAIADQTGFGKILSMGSECAAKTLGKGFEYLMTVKGIEFPMHDPKWAPGYARTYQFDPTPGRHVKGGLGHIQLGSSDPSKYNYQGTGYRDLLMTTYIDVEYCAGLCLFLFSMGAGPESEAPRQMIEAVTGWDFKEHDQLKAGMRIMNMRQAFNLREGFRPADLVLPRRVVGEPPLTQGPLAGIFVDTKALARNYFAYAGWDEETGKPSRRSLEMLGGMDDVVKDLYG